MRILEYVVPLECQGATVKEFARNRLGFSARMLAKQKRAEGGVLKNGVPCRVTDTVRAGDTVSFPVPEEHGEYPAVQGNISILFENEDYLVVDKPPAMPVHPSPGHDSDSLLNAAAYHCRETGQNCLFRPLYRLDRDTSGVIVLGKHRAAASCARLEKRYYAVCQGILSGSGVIDLPIGLKPGSRIVRECGHGEKAVTRWRALAFGEGCTLLALTLETGRTHQIRAHLSHLGHPVAGDDLYGGSRERIGRQALHCGLAELSCPALDMERTFWAQLPTDIKEAFPWLPDWKTLQEEELLCRPV